MALLGFGSQPCPLQPLQHELEALETLFEGCVEVWPVRPDHHVVQIRQTDLPAEALQRGFDHALHVGGAGAQTKGEDVELPLSFAGHEGEPFAVGFLHGEVPESCGEVEGVEQEVAAELGVGARGVVDAVGGAVEGVA